MCGDDMKYDQPVTVKLNSIIVGRIDKLVDSSETTRSTLMREVICEYVERKRKEDIEMHGINELEALGMIEESIDDGSYRDEWMVRKGIRREDVKHAFVVADNGKLKKATEGDIDDCLEDDYIGIYNLNLTSGYDIETRKSMRRSVIFNKEFGILVMA